MPSKHHKDIPNADEPLPLEVPVVTSRRRRERKWSRVASISPDHDERVFFTASAYFAALLADIAKAENSIEIEAYIFEADKLGKQVLEELAHAVARKVKVRVLVDGVGSSQWGGRLVRSLEKAGAQTRIFHPFPWRLWQWSRSFVRVPSVLKAIYLFLKMNSRNHRKICIIDKKIAYIGSFNISQKHLEKEHEGAGWRDTGVRLAGIDLDDLSHAFESAWDNVTIQERLRQIFRRIYANQILRLNNTRHRRRILYKNLLARISRCHERVWITNAYFVPDNFLLKKLTEAASVGVDVRILLPKKSDVAFMPWASNSFYENLLKAGVRIYEYLPSVLHAKTLIIDNWMLVGSSNLNHRSLMHDLEVDVDIRLDASKSALLAQFNDDLANAKEITLDNWQKPPFYQRFIGRLMLYVKYYI